MFLKPHTIQCYVRQTTFSTPFSVQSVLHWPTQGVCASIAAALPRLFICIRPVKKSPHYFFTDLVVYKASFC